MASADSVTKLRSLLDELAVDAVDRPGGERPYHQAVLDYLDVRFEQRTVGGSDEAMRVITPEEWSLANQARLAAEERGKELDDMRAHLEDLQSREDLLKARVDELESALEEARDRREELVTFDLVGVRHEEAAEPEEELVEFEVAEPTPEQTPEPTPGQPARQGPVAWQETESPQAGWAEAKEDAWQAAEPAAAPEEEEAWEPAGEPAADEETWEPAGGEEEEEPAWEAEEEPRVQAPPAQPEAVQVEEEIRNIEDEIRKIEEELALIAAQERELEERGVEPTKQPEEPAPTPAAPSTGPAPYRQGDYTLFVKDVKNPDGSKRPFYFFARDESRDDAEPTPMPEGYEVGENARTGMPYLRRAAQES